VCKSYNLRRYSRVASKRCIKAQGYDQVIIQNESKDRVPIVLLGKVLRKEAMGTTDEKYKGNYILLVDPESRGLAERNIILIRTKAGPGLALDCSNLNCGLIWFVSACRSE
jgi:hypothetical protein